MRRALVSFNEDQLKPLPGCMRLFNSGQIAESVLTLACNPHLSRAVDSVRINVLCTSRRFQAEQKHKNEVEHFTLSYSARKSSKK